MLSAAFPRLSASLLAIVGVTLLFGGCPGTRGISDGDEPAPFGAEAQPLQEAPDREADCICPMIHEPVCGEDGRTYGNDCMAGCANVAIAHRGECGEADGSETAQPEAPGSPETPDGPESVEAPSEHAEAGDEPRTYRYHLCNDTTPCDDGYVCVNVREGCRPSNCSGTPWEGFGICTRDCRMGYGLCVPQGMPVSGSL